jgi:hypothetical protein
VLASKLNHIPEIGDKLEKKNIPASAFKNMCAITADDFYPCFRPKIDGIEFMIAFEEHTFRVEYITTQDPKFKTADGLKVGDVIDVQEKDLVDYESWDIFAPRTRDGWRPIVGVSLFCSKDGTDKYGLCGNVFRKAHPGKAEIMGFSKGGWS